MHVRLEGTAIEGFVVRIQTTVPAKELEAWLDKGWRNFAKSFWVGFLLSQITRKLKYSFQVSFQFQDGTQYNVTLSNTGFNVDKIPAGFRFIPGEHP